MTNISIILALRHQSVEFLYLVASIIEKTSDIDKIEMLVVIDEDDTETLYFLNCVIAHNKQFFIRKIITKRSKWFVRDYYNFAARMAYGRWVIYINADSYFKTQDWDRIVNDKMSKAALTVGDDILSGIVEDGLDEKDKNIGFSSWSLSSKEYITLMGGILDDRIPAWGADVALGQVFNALSGVSRKVFIPEVFIDHMSHHVYKHIKPSEHTKTFQKLQHDFPAFLTPEQVTEVANKINNYLHSR